MSTSSMFLRDSSFVSLIESEAIPKHSYFTRSAARLLAQKSKSSLVSNTSSSDRDLVVRPSKPTSDTPENRYLGNCDRATQSKTSIWYSFGQFRSTTCESEKMPRACQPLPILTCPQETTCTERACKCLFLLLAIGGIIVFCSYLGNSLSDSQGSLRSVKKDLQNIKIEMECLKEDVQNVVNSKQATERKLEIIEGLLREMKIASRQTIEEKKCGPHQEKSRLGENNYVRREVYNALEEYDADKTGKTDFALESSGGSILTVRDTESYPAETTVTFFGVSLCEAGNGPRAMINPGVLPGECWAFKGSKGRAVIKLLGNVRITSVSLEHIPKSISPSGVINTAPKEFSIWGLSSVDDNEGEFLGQFIYDTDGPSIQFFNVEPCARAYRIIEFKVHSNHGHPDFTCVYRLRVHGVLEGKL